MKVTSLQCNFGEPIHNITREILQKKILAIIAKRDEKKNNIIKFRINFHLCKGIRCIQYSLGKGIKCTKQLQMYLELEYIL